MPESLPGFGKPWVFAGALAGCTALALLASHAASAVEALVAARAARVAASGSVAGPSAAVGGPVGDRAALALGLPAAATPVEGTARYHGVVGTSIYRAARTAGASPREAQRYLVAIAPLLDGGADLMPSDRFDFAIAYPQGRLVFARLTDAAGQPRRAPAADGVAEAGASLLALPGASGLAMPVPGRITSGYGMRFHPLLGYVRMHDGIDIAATWGTPIRAAAAGQVRFAGWHGGHGEFVQLDHGGGLGTGYAHMSRIAVRPGEAVRAGEVIGYVGSTGLSTGPHLHFEAYRDGRTLDPEQLRGD